MHGWMINTNTRYNYEDEGMGDGVDGVVEYGLGPLGRQFYGTAVNRIEKEGINIRNNDIIMVGMYGYRSAQDTIRH